MKKIIISILLLGLIGGASAYYYAFVYMKNRKFDMVNAEAASVYASVLVKAYQENETSANASYLDKVLLISGTVSATDQTQMGERTLTLSSEDPFSGVMVTLDSAEAASVNVNDQVKVKGFCKGYLSDVVVTNAIIVK
ncbi:MAG: OB-fold protein [Bacteroidota bacterium]